MPADPQPLNVLFLCTHNSARSILAEATLNHLGGTRFRGFSAGSAPRDGGGPHPLALQTLVAAGIATEGLYSKSWTVFAGPGAPVMDLIVTVCDSAAGEVCPVWPGHPATVHWGYPDPSAGGADEALMREAFAQTLGLMRARLAALVALPADALVPGVIGKRARDLAGV